MALRSLCIVSLRSQTGIARLQHSNATSSQNKWRAYLVQKWSTAENPQFFKSFNQWHESWLHAKPPFFLSFVRSKSACRISARLKLIHYDYLSLRMLPPGHTGLNAICRINTWWSRTILSLFDTATQSYFLSTYRKESLSFHTALIVLLILYEGICHRNCWDRSVVIHPSLTQSDFVRPQSVELPLIPPLLRSASPLGTIYHRYWKLGGVYCVISPRSFAEREESDFFKKSRCITVFEQEPIGCYCCIFPAVCSFWK